MRLAEKYKPKRLKEILGQPQAISQMLIWLSTWQKGRPLIIYGPPGTGKSASVQALAAEQGFEIIEFDEDSEPKQIFSAIKQCSLLGKKRLIVIEDADRFQSRILLKIAKESCFPVIFFVNELWKSKLKALRAISEVIQFKKLHRETIRKKLLEVKTAEKLNAKIDYFADAVNGDMRAALIDIDVGEQAARDRSTNIFEVLRCVFNGPYERALHALKSADKDPKQILWWIEENILAQFTKPKQYAAAYEILSIADWRKSKALELLAGLCTIGARKSFTSYKPPKYKPADEIPAELPRALHCSSSKARKEFPYIKIILKDSVHA